MSLPPHQTNRLALACLGLGLLGIAGCRSLDPESEVITRQLR